MTARLNPIAGAAVTENTAGANSTGDKQGALASELKTIQKSLASGVAKSHSTYQKLHEQLLTEIYKNRLLCTEILRHVNPNALAALTAEFDEYDRATTGAARGEKTQKIAPRLNGAKTSIAREASEKSAAQDALQALDHDDVEEEMAR